MNKCLLLLVCSVFVAVTGCAEKCCPEVSWHEPQPIVSPCDVCPELVEPVVRPYDVAPEVTSEPTSDLLLLAEPETVTTIPSYEPKCMDSVETALSTGRHDTFVTAVQAAGLEETLKSQGPFTVFAPTDRAFSKLAPGVLQDYLKPENKEELEKLLQYHIVPGKYSGRDLKILRSITNMTGQTLEISECPSCFNIGDAKVLQEDIYTCNGVIHIVDQVLLPE